MSGEIAFKALVVDLVAQGADPQQAERIVTEILERAYLADLAREQAGWPR